MKRRNKQTNKPTDQQRKRARDGDRERERDGERRIEKIHNNKANISAKVKHFAFALCYLCCAKWNVKCESEYENI